NWVSTLNTDGSFMKEQRRAGLGGVVRKGSGEIVMAFAKPCQFLTNNYSEVQAALFVLKWCCRRNFNHLTLEMDYLIVVNMISGKYKIPWSLHSTIGQIQELVQQRNITIGHCYMEGNAVADSLAKLATQIEDSVLYLREEDMETEVRAHIYMDASKIPAFHFKTTKHSGWCFQSP
ncbi:hypothetical protein A4A49_65207, partial [Nicotiana attenuata]